MTIRKGAGISDHAWLAELPENNLESFEVRHRLISKLASLNKPTRASICAIASDLGVSDRWVRKLLARYQESDGDALSVLPGKRGAPVGRTRQPKTTEEVVLQVLERRFANRQKPSLKFVHKEICEICRQRGLRAPTAKTVTARLREFEPVRLTRLREGRNAAQAVRSAGGMGPQADCPLHIVQMDHTKADLLIVDSVDRQEAQRPWLTFAIDLYSRCIVGYHVSVEAPC